MKAALVRVPTIIDASASTAPVCPPVGLAYLKRVVSGYTRDLTIVDSIGNDPDVIRTESLGGKNIRVLGQSAETIAQQVSPETSVILVSIMFSQDWPYVLTTLRALRARAKGAIIIAGGEHITAAPEFSLEASPEIDLCVVGEGEATLKEILKKIQASSEIPQGIPGTFYRNEHGKPVMGEGKRERIRNVDDIDWPDWDGFPLENYFAGGHGFGVNRGPSMPIVATRGCPYQCTFCSNPAMWGTLWKYRDAEDVVEEMAFYVEKYGVENFDFYDLTAIVRKDWIVRFCNLLLERNLNVFWQLPSGTRSEAIDDEVADLLYRSGCRNLSYAPESGSESMLSAIKKRIDVNKMLVSMRACVARGLSIKANIICGFPEEKWRHLVESLGFITKMAWVGIDDMSINQFSPYPGSELFRVLVANGKVEMNDEYFESLSFYSSMTNARSYSLHLSNRDIIIYKIIGTALFYSVSFCRRPWRMFRAFFNAWKGVENTRLEKTLNSYFSRVKFGKVNP